MIRKILLYLILLLTAATACQAKPAITADEQYLDSADGTYILNGHVCISNDGRTVTAGKVKIDMTSLDAYGSGGICLKQPGLSFTADEVYVYSSKKYAAINGHVQFSSGSTAITSDTAIFNWDTKLIEFSGHIITGHDTAAHADKLIYDLQAAGIVNDNR